MGWCELNDGCQPASGDPHISASLTAGRWGESRENPARKASLAIFALLKQRLILVESINQRCRLGQDKAGAERKDEA